MCWQAGGSKTNTLKKLHLRKANLHLWAACLHLRVFKAILWVKLASGNRQFASGNRKLAIVNRQFAIAGSVFGWHKAECVNWESSAIGHLNYCTRHKTNSKGLVTNSIYRSSYSSGHAANSIRGVIIV